MYEHSINWTNEPVLSKIHAHTWVAQHTPVHVLLPQVRMVGYTAVCIAISTVGVVAKFAGVGVVLWVKGVVARLLLLNA